jgi:hypothetical protein
MRTLHDYGFDEFFPAGLLRPSHVGFSILGMDFPAQAKGSQPAPLGTPGFFIRQQNIHVLRRIAGVHAR